MFNDFKRVLVLASHTDDAELGCGGTIAGIVNSEKEVFWAVFGKAYVPKSFSLDPNIVLKEMKESASIIGIKDKNILIYDFPVRHFPEHRQEILEKILELKKRVKPDLVFMPTLSDFHQDHSVISKEGLRALKDVTILGYENPWNHLNFNTTCFVFLSREEVDKKAKAIEKYKSQVHRGYINEGFVKSLARARGIQIAPSNPEAFAEAFEVIRLVFKEQNEKKI